MKTIVIILFAVVTSTSAQWLLAPDPQGALAIAEANYEAAYPRSQIKFTRLRQTKYVPGRTDSLAVTLDSTKIDTLRGVLSTTPPGKRSTIIVKKMFITVQRPWTQLIRQVVLWNDITNGWKNASYSFPIVADSITFVLECNTVTKTTAVLDYYLRWHPFYQDSTVCVSLLEPHARAPKPAPASSASMPERMATPQMDRYRTH